MPSNTTNLEGYTVFSSVSLAGSGSTLLAQDITSRGSIVGNWGQVTNMSIASWSLSILTAASATAIPSGYLGLIQQASGFSLIYKSGTTVYTVGASAVSA
jgi:hypothetical protein